MGAYGFFTKSAIFLLLLHYVVFSFPTEVETLTGGRLNTSTISGTNITLEKPDKFTEVTTDDKIDLGSPLQFSNVEINSEGYVVLENGTSSGYVTYNISKFDKNSNGFYEVYVDGEGLNPIFGEDHLIQEATVDIGIGPQRLNDSVTQPQVYDTIVGDNITYYFNGDKAEIRSIEDSTQAVHAEDKTLTRQFLETTGLTGFATSLANLYSLYTAPETGNRILGMIFTVYLLGFTVFILSEVLPG